MRRMLKDVDIRMCRTFRKCLLVTAGTVNRLCTCGCIAFVSYFTDRLVLKVSFFTCIFVYLVLSTCDGIFSQILIYVPVLSKVASGGCQFMCIFMSSIKCHFMYFYYCVNNKKNNFMYLLCYLMLRKVIFYVYTV